MGRANRFRCGLSVFWLGALPALVEQTPIQDNSFLVEEAYNQEKGVVQHINTFSRMWNSKDWSYTFTQEWPGTRDPRHQFSYTLTGMHYGAFAGSGAGWGDVAFHYRYQLVGGGESRFAFSPRLSMILPTGSPDAGRGLGATGVQASLPASLVLTRRLVTHWNVGSTVVRQARSPDGFRAGTASYNAGQSLVVLAHPRFNLMLEHSVNRSQSVIGNGRTDWSTLCYLSPGIRWAYNFSSGLQIVPGVAVPIGYGPSAGEKSVFVYLSFEHPIGRRAAP